MDINKILFLELLATNLELSDPPEKYQDYNIPSMINGGIDPFITIECSWNETRNTDPEDEYFGNYETSLECKVMVLTKEQGPYSPGTYSHIKELDIPAANMLLDYYNYLEK